MSSEIKMKCQEDYFKWVSAGSKIQVRHQGKWIKFCDTSEENPSFQHLELDIGDKGAFCLTWDENKKVTRATVVDFEFFELTQHYWRKGEKKPKQPQFKFQCIRK